jgi:DHA1 family tetracycline resistance protein-like MFS transporter
MGITTAAFTLVAGIMCVLGGDFMGVDFRAPFYIVIAAAIFGFIIQRFVWQQNAIKRITAIDTTTIRG